MQFLTKIIKIIHYSVKKDFKEKILSLFTRKKSTKTISYFFSDSKAVNFEYHNNKLSHIKNLDYTVLYLIPISKRFTISNILPFLLCLYSTLKITFLNSFRKEKR